jgi:hypothetical protein
MRMGTMSRVHAFRRPVVSGEPTRERYRHNRLVWHAFRLKVAPLEKATRSVLHCHNLMYGEATPLISINATKSDFKLGGRVVACVKRSRRQEIGPGKDAETRDNRHRWI